MQSGIIIIINSHSKNYVLGTQKNCLIETVLLSTHNIMFKIMGKKSIAILCTKLFGILT